MRCAGVFVLAVAGAACGSSDLQPIRPPAPDGGFEVVQDAGPAEAPPPVGDASMPAGRACKRGIASNTAPSSAFAPTASSPGIAWWYNWDNQPASGGDARIEFVPMLWGGMSLGQSIPSASKSLLGFNEPNFKLQANLTTEQAAGYWPSVEAKASPLRASIASPGVNFCGSGGDSSQCTEASVTDPYTYLKDFLAECPGCKVDYIAVHWYNCDLPSLRAYLEGNGDGGLQGFVQFGKPIWLTEFSCDSTHSVADQMAYMQDAIPYLENNPNVMRYAWFNAKGIPNAELANADGSLTDLGQLYVGLAQNCP
jgi:Glycosyl hydrolase catalytic core